MLRAARPAVLAVALVVTVGSGAASAQTVVVRGAPPGSTVEFVLDTTAIGSTKADGAGDATLSAGQSASAVKGDIDASIFVDVCENLHRVLIVGRGVLPPPEQAGCSRKQIAGLFLVRGVSTLVVNVAGPNPGVLLRQGPVDLRATVRTWSSSATGLVLSGAGGFATFGNARTVACGDVTPCSGENGGLAYGGSVAFWITRFLAAEAGYLRPAAAAIEGSGQGFRFNSELDAHVFTFTGKVGGPIGPVRLYGQAGASYSRATFGTTQTVEDVSTTVDGVTTVVAGGTQAYELKTAGWGWVFGGGMEFWLTPRFALYADGGRLAVKGAGLDDADGSVADHLNFIVGGARVRIGR